MEIKYDKVGYTYNPKTKLKKVALKNITTEIPEGKVTAIIGRSGSGKTTMIEMIDALLFPTTGEVKIDNDILSSDAKIKNINKLRRKVGYVFQFPEDQFFNLSVKKEIEFSLLNFKYKVNELDKRISDSLKMVGLDDSYLDRDPFKLSNGEKRKVAIASVLAYNPKVLIFDEPTIGLDYESKKNLIKILRLLKIKYNKTIILISHDVDFIHLISDHVILLDKGSIVASGNKYQILTDSALLEIYHLPMPKVVEFANKVYRNKGVKMGYRDDINDLLKDIYRYVR